MWLMSNQHSEGGQQCGCDGFELDPVASAEAGEPWCRCDHGEDSHDGHCQGVAAASPLTFQGLTHECTDPGCHVPGFIATLGRTVSAGVPGQGTDSPEEQWWLEDPILGAAAAQALFNYERGDTSVTVRAEWLYAVCKELDARRSAVPAAVSSSTGDTERRIRQALAEHHVGAFGGTDTACACDRTWRKNRDYDDHLVAAIAAALGGGL